MIIPPVLSALINEPRLLAEHLDGYAELAQIEWADAQRAWQRRLLLWLLTVLCGALALGLGGVALLLWAALPLESMPHPWLLAAAPGALLLAALVLGVAATRSPGARFTGLREQWREDTALLRQSMNP